MLINLNTDFIAGKMMLIRGIIGEMKIYITEPCSNPFLDLKPEQHFDFLSFVPLQIETILTKTPEKTAILNQAKAIIIGGSPISNQLHSLIQSCNVPISFVIQIPLQSKCLLTLCINYTIGTLP